MPATATIKTRSIQAESLAAVHDRLVNTVLLLEGVVAKTANSFKVAQDTGSNMQVKVGSATAYDRAVVQGDVAGQGVYIVEHQNATQTLVIAASHPTLPRIDIVVLRVYDTAFDASGNSYADLEVITGTAAASPTAPAVPATAIKLADVAVAAAATAITNANITDTRADAKTNGAAPGGVLGYSQVTANQSGITSETDLTSMTLTISPPANRRIKITFSGLVTGSVANDVYLVRIKEGSTTLTYDQNNIHAASVDQGVDGSIVLIPTAATHTYKLSLQRLTGTGSLTWTAAATRPGWLLIEDLGPA